MLKEKASQMGLGEQVSLWPPTPARLGKTRKNRRAGCIYICVALRMNGSNSQIANIVSLKCRLLKSFSYSIVRYASWVLVDVGTSAHEGLSSTAKGDRDLAKWFSRARLEQAASRHKVTLYNLVLFQLSYTEVF